MRSSAVMERDRLMAVVRRVRRRWRLRLVLTGLAILAGGSLLVVAGSAALIETFRFDPGVVRVLKLVAWVAVGLLAGRFLLRPLRRRVSDAQVALYLEEREPTLGGLVVSAVDCGAHQASPASPVLVERLVERALERSAEIDFGWRVERMALRRSSGTLAGIAALGAVLLLGGPPWLGRGALVLAPWRGAEEANPYRIDVLPRDTVVARGSDLRVEARLTGFEAGEVDLVTRRGAQGEWSR
ncbi:MAG TPA: hypothetical protein VD793_09420, partial [Gemmatimonadales bacterium]|nr:hypothetical protein [Gemmatimonadales bacterium]